MAKRKSDPTLAGQLDLFGGLESAPIEKVEAVEAANDVWIAPVHAPCQDIECDTPISESLSKVPQIGKSPPEKAHNLALADEWWTLNMVCAYLKLGRKAVWERKRDPDIGFPKAVCHGSSRPRWRSQEVRAWADQSYHEADARLG
jgi:predicted DNA-binding transcriptional regulator AlpA